jgi:ssRNA-specific RNase YbeY (16S rRNA maturation enzyme)
MTKPVELSDADLQERALAWRRLALQGVLHARGYAHEHETELRRRNRAPMSLSDRLGPPLAASPAPRRWWRFW